MLGELIDMRFEITSVILFVIGFLTLLINPNLIKKIIGMDIMDSAIFLFLTTSGAFTGRSAPIITNGITDASAYVSPVPAGLVLTGIVVSVSTTAVFLALTYRLYKKYGTLMLDEIVLKSKEEVGS